MHQTIRKKIDSYVEKSKKRRIWKTGVSVLACFVVFCTVYHLMLPALTAEETAYCGDEAHEHTLSCYSNPEADLEDASIWEETLPSRSGDILNDLVSVAQSQVGYRESEKNYEVVNDTELSGYTRYGQWAGDPYGPWTLYFTRFVMDYAGAEAPFAQDTVSFMNALDTKGILVPAESGMAQAGDLAFFERQGSLLVGIIQSVDTEGNLSVIAGDDDNCVMAETFAKDGGEVQTVARMNPTEETLPEESPEGEGTETDQNTEEVTPSEPPAEENTPSQDTVAPPVEGNTDSSVNPEGPFLKDPAPDQVLLEREETFVWAEVLPKERVRAFFRSLLPSVFQNTGLDMRDMITDVTIEKKVPSTTDTWESIGENATVNEKDEIRFQIKYRVPGGTLSPGNDTITYKLPNAIKPLKEERGHVVNSSQQIVGEYVIKTDGTISIQFSEDFVKSNSENQPISGHVKFHGNIDQISGGSGNDVALDFTDNIIFHVKVEEYVPTEGDIRAEKTGRELKEEGLIEYTVFVRSDQGTYGNVVVKEHMTAGLYEKDLKVTKNDGSVVNVPQPAKGSKDFNLTLPKLAAGEFYKITYKAKVDGDTLAYINNQTLVKNRVDCESTDSLGQKIEGSAQTETPVYVVQKSGEYDKERDVMKWKLKINPYHMDISGWKLTDVCFGTQQADKITILDEHGHAVISTFPYVFPEGSTDCYTILYETKPLHDGVGQDWVSNEAKLIRGDTLIGHAVAGMGIGTISPIHKSGQKPELSGETILTTWTVTIDAMPSVTRDLFVHDELPDDATKSQYMTRAQLEDARRAVEACMRANGYTTDSWKVKQFNVQGDQDWDTTATDDRYRGFSYRIFEPDGYKKASTYTYQTSADLEEGPVTLHNKVNLDNKASAEAEVTYYPTKLTVKKYDPTQPGASPSKHNWEAIDNNTLKWRIDLFIPENMRNQNITLTETLPAGTVLDGLFMDMPLWYEFHKFKNPDTREMKKEIEGITYTIHAKRNGNSVELIFPADLTKKCKGEYHMEFWVKTDKNTMPWVDREGGLIHDAELENTVIVKGPGNPVSATHTQVITENDIKNSVQKTGKISGNNIIEYEVVVNPKGLDLLKQGDTITLTDTLVHGQNETLSALLLKDSVKVKKTDGTLLDTSYVRSEEQDKPEKGKTTYTLKMDLPDETPLTVTYQYLFIGNISDGPVEVNNDAKLEGFTEQGGSDQTSIQFEIQDSGATADVQGITVYKVDEKNNSLSLLGAEFALYRYDKNEGNYVPLTGKNGSMVFVTDKDGKLGITTETLNQVAYNTAYKLVETKAPQGYMLNQKPYYFYISKTDLVTYPLCMPEDFKGVRLLDGALVYYDNLKMTRNLKLIKNWYDIDGSALTDPGVDKVTFNLYQSSKEEGKRLYGSYTLEKAHGWKYTVENLPIGIQGEDGTLGEKYIYSVEEVSVPGFEITSNASNIEEGYISVSNRKTPGYELPETGGIGILFYLVSGGLLVLLSGGMLLKRRHG